MAKILLVEDDTVLREGLLELFTRDGYQVVTAGSVREARERLAGDIQAVVMDVGLPDGDGVGLCREWRTAGETRPVLFLTARGEEFDVVRGLVIIQPDNLVIQISRQICLCCLK